MFLSDVSTASFSIPSTGFGKTLKKVGESIPGKLLFKDARIVKHYDKLGNLVKNTNGIAQSGKSLRTSPFLVAGGIGATYGGYRAKKTYDKYKPEIETGRKLMRKYNQFKNMFNKEGN
jgi:hypothetical protein